jgi:ATP-dependent exoDNAse (exonuclease V) beta subunit
MSHVDNDMAKAERLLIDLLKRRDQWLLHIGLAGDPSSAKQKLERTLQRIITDVLYKISDELLSLAPELLPLFDYAGCNMQWHDGDSVIRQLAGIIALPNTKPESVEQWLAVAELLLTKSGGWRKSVNKRTGFPTETQDGDKALAKDLKERFGSLLKSFHNNDDLLQLFAELRHLPTAEFASNQWELLESLTRILPSLVAQLTLEFQLQGEVDYSQISMAALDALGDGLNPTELAMKLDHQLRHILIDEFQDTASTQFKLLERLLEGWQEHNVNNPDRPNTIFIVGDGMQSIYGFRQANVGLFLEARKQGINGVELDDLPLTVNFRSDPIIVSWINKTFSQAFPQLENLSRGAVPFEHAQSFNGADEASEISVLGFTGDQARVQEAEKTVELIHQSLQQNPLGTIAVLVRSRGHLRDIIPAFTRAGLSWKATDIDPLANYSPIIDLLSLTKALFNIADNISWAALLRTPWIGLANNDIHILLASTQGSVWSAIFDESQYAELSSHGRKRLSVVRHIFLVAYQQRQRQTARNWIEGVWLALGGAASVDGLDEFRFIDDYFDLLEKFQQGEMISSLSLFEQAIQKLYAAPENTNCNVHVMTIHKSKGLEFDTVILPATGRASRSDDKSLLMWREYLPLKTSELATNSIGAGLIISPLGATDDEEDKIFKHLRFEQSQSNALENTRLFYVAATRAVKKLYILLSSEINEKSGEPRNPSGNSLINSAWPSLKEDAVWFETTLPKTTEQLGLDFDSLDQSSQLKRLKVDWREPAWNFQNPLEPFYLDNNPIKPSNTDTKIDKNLETDSTKYKALALNVPELIVDHLPKCIGTVTHWILDILVERGVDFWLQMDNQSQSDWLDSLCHYHNLPAALCPQACEHIATAVNNTVSDSKGLWLLSSLHQQSLTESEVLTSIGGIVKKKTIDRSFIDEEGDLWIVDYKTALPLVNESRGDFITRQVDSYQRQLQDYKSLWSIKLNRDDIKIALYFTCYPYFQQLE